MHDGLFRSQETSFLKATAGTRSSSCASRPDNEYPGYPLSRRLVKIHKELAVFDEAQKGTY